MSGPRPTTSLQASLRLFRLAMTTQRRAAEATAAATTAAIGARPAAATAFSGGGARAAATGAAATGAAAASPQLGAGLGGGRIASLLPMAAARALATTTAATTTTAAAAGANANAHANARTYATSATTVRLNDLHPALGATKAVRRVGRGDGSGRGKTCGRGTKGQGSRKGGGKPGLLFDGGTRQLRKWPKVHAKPGSPVAYDYVNLADVASAAREGRLGGLDFASLALSSASASSAAAEASATAAAAAPGDSLPLVTMKHLRDAGLVSKSVRWGVKLLARADPTNAATGATGATGATTKQQRPLLLPPMRLQVSAASAAARREVAAAGGRVEAVYYNRLGFRALLKPEAWAREGRPLPRGVRAWPPRDEGKFDFVGSIPPRAPLAAAEAAAAAAASPSVAAA